MKKNYDTYYEFDFALLILDSTLGFFTGWFGLMNLPNNTINHEKVGIIGYPLVENI